MTQPLAIVCYEILMPGSQLVNRLHDLGYRVKALTSAAQLAAEAATARPIVVLADLRSEKCDVCAQIAALRKNKDTAHIPVIAFADTKTSALHASARDAGATLVASASGVMAQLPQLLEQALEVP